MERHLPTSPNQDGSSASAERTVVEDLIGHHLAGRYHVESKVGAGGFGIVYCAWDSQRRRAVAIKVLREEFFGRKAQRGRFEREAEALVALSHPHVVAVTDYGVDGYLPFLVMELLQGLTLDVELKRQGALEVPRSFALIGQLLDGLGYIHGRGLVHRDVKPANIFLHRTRSGREQLKLLDFGLAKFLEGSERPVEATLTHSGDIFGTPGYMPPEQMASERADCRADIYGAAVVFYEMLTGRRPFIGAAHEVLRMVLVEPPPPVQSVCPARHAHPDLELALARAMAKAPSDRFPDAASFAKALARVPKPGVLDLNGIDPFLTPSPVRSSHVRPTRSALELSEIRGGRQTLARAVATTIGRLQSNALVLACIVGLACLGLTAAAVALVLSGQRSAAPEAQPSPHSLSLEGGHDSRSQSAWRPQEARRLAKPANSGKTRPPAPGYLPTPGPPLANAERVKAVEHTENASPMAPSAHNPWLKDAPEALRLLYVRALRGARGNRRMIARLERYNRTRPEDSRGHLVLAQLCYNRNDAPCALAHYRAAFERNPSAQGDPAMRRNLRALASYPDTNQAAAALWNLTYGAEPLPTTGR